MSDETPLQAFWPGGRRVQPGRDAQDYLDAAAIRFGQSPAWIRKSVIRDTPAGRMILAMLGLTRGAVVPPNRPPDVFRALLIVSVVEDLVDAGRTETEAFADAPRYLADPKLRIRSQIGRGKGEALGKGGRFMAASAVREAYRTARDRNLIAKLWFLAPGETGESAISATD